MRRRSGWLWGALMALLAAGCGSSGSDFSVDPDPAVAPFVGDWRASVLVLTNLENPTIAPDLVKLGATFDLNVQPSGQYTAILLFRGQSQTELGSISVSGSTITLQRRFPTAGTNASTYAFKGDTLVLDGNTEFDFNLDGTAEPALAHIEFVPKR